MAAPPKEESGRQVPRPSDDEVRFVRAMAGYGIARDDIAAVIRGGVSVGELERHFSAALHEGQVEANAKVAESLFNQAIGKTKIIEDGKVIEAGAAPVASAAIFWLKAHGWSEAQGGAKLASVSKAVFDPAKLSTRELKRLETLLEKAITGSTGRTGESGSGKL
ncbi:MAG: hypothetical protein O7C63_09295 [Alphaproteobacteria bacterium]|nr:hypothetical protein [Alphaproteobacteria bacterium]MCZ6765114.1 hypothetical protein [Alphaproteobacteria bacterium]